MNIPTFGNALKPGFVFSIPLRDREVTVNHEDCVAQSLSHAEMGI